MIGKQCDILYISSHHANKMRCFINKGGITHTKPLLIKKYNTYMSVVDRNTTHVEKKTVWWYKDLFFHYLHIIVVNLFLLFNKYTLPQKMSLYDFQLNIIRTLLLHNGGWKDFLLIQQKVLNVCQQSVTVAMVKLWER